MFHWSDFSVSSYFTLVTVVQKMSVSLVLQRTFFIWLNTFLGASPKQNLRVRKETSFVLLVVKTDWSFQVFSALTSTSCTRRFVWNLNKKQETVKGVWLLILFALAHYLGYAHRHTGTDSHTLKHTQFVSGGAYVADLPSALSAFALLWEAPSQPG